MAIDWPALAAKFKEAEEALHEAELVHSDLTVASVNQLRYAGHHILSALVGSEVTSEEDARRAERHCQRAIYDAYDSIVIYLLEYIDQFKRDYSIIQIMPSFPKYSDITKQARESQAIIKAARSDHDNREMYYEVCRDAAKGLILCKEAMEDAREELNKVLAKHNRVAVIGWLTVGLTALTLFATVVSVYVAYRQAPVGGIPSANTEAQHNQSEK